MKPDLSRFLINPLPETAETPAYELYRRVFWAQRRQQATREEVAAALAQWKEEQAESQRAHAAKYLTFR